MDSGQDISPQQSGKPLETPPMHTTLATPSESKDNNFTLIRFVAAYAVLFSHCWPIARGSNVQNPVSVWLISWWGQGLGSLAVSIFFAISGFLITASYLHRASLLAFIEARALRIFPALLVAVGLTALIVGPWVTSLRLSDYFSSKQVWSYLWHNSTLLAGAHFRLPGVFEDLPHAGGVNGSLWTLPVELYLYGFVAILGSFSLLQRPVPGNIALLLVFATASLLLHYQLVDKGLLRNSLPLVLSYAWGMFFCINRARIPLGLGSLGLVVVTVFLLHGTPVWPLARAFGTAYLVLFVALHPAIRLPPMEKWGDFSYGLYIYAMPMQQLVMMYFAPSPMGLLLYASLATVPVAMLSWYVIEKPALQWKGRIVSGRRWLDPRAGS